MKVRVKYLAVINSVTGKYDEEIEVNEGETIAGLVERLANIYGQRFRDVVYTCGGPRRYFVNFYHNGRLAPPEAILNPGDEVILLLALGGG